MGDNEKSSREEKKSGDVSVSDVSELTRIAALLSYYPFKGIDRFYDISG